MQKIESRLLGTSDMGFEQHMGAHYRMIEFEQLVRYLLSRGLVLTVEQVSVEPLRMGNYKHVITLRPSRGSNT